MTDRSGLGAFIKSKLLKPLKFIHYLTPHKTITVIFLIFQRGFNVSSLLKLSNLTRFYVLVTCSSKSSTGHRRLCLKKHLALQQVA